MSRLCTMSANDMDAVVSRLREDTTGDYVECTGGRVAFWNENDDYYEVWRWLDVNGEYVWVLCYQYSAFTDIPEEETEEIDALLADLACTGEREDAQRYRQPIRRTMNWMRTHHSKPKRAKGAVSIRKLSDIEGD